MIHSVKEADGKFINMQTRYKGKCDEMAKLRKKFKILKDQLLKERDTTTTREIMFKDQSTIESDDEEIQSLRMDENAKVERESIMLIKNDGYQVAILKDENVKLEDQLHAMEAEKQQSNLVIQELR